MKFSHSYSRSILLRSGPKIRVSIGHSSAEQRAGAGSGISSRGVLTITALVDTGASRTIINPQVANTCKLRHIGEARISSAGHITNRPEYVGAIVFPDSELQGFDPIRLVACPLPGQDVSCLLGRDVLERWIITYDGRSGFVEIEE